LRNGLLLMRAGWLGGGRTVPGILGDDLSVVLQQVVGCFRRARVLYVLIGAWALAVWGRPRATVDVDFLVLVNEEDLNRLGSVMTRAGMDLDETWLDWNPILRGYQLRFHYHSFTIDLLRPRDPHDQQIFQQRRKKRMDGQYYWVVAPEDFILQKLKVGRPKDFEDALSILEQLRDKLDLTYLEQWARKLGVREELDYIMAS
jgi:hypothetical protein